MSIKISIEKLCTLHYTRNQVIFAEDQQHIDCMFRKLNAEYTTRNQTLNKQKAEYIASVRAEKDMILDRDAVKRTVLEVPRHEGDQHR